MNADAAAIASQHLQDKPCLLSMNRSDAQEEVRLLGLAATQYRYSDDAAAVECLRRAQAITRAISDNSQSIEWWMRLPKYLASASRLPEAREVCQQLIDEVAARWGWQIVGTAAFRRSMAARERRELKKLLTSLR